MRVIRAKMEVAMSNDYIGIICISESDGAERIWHVSADKADTPQTLYDHASKYFDWSVFTFIGAEVCRNER